jgi:predicted transcriptional regulator/GNAT superfamily N-acetyltransferase/predicted nucleic acid-binding protein
MPYLLTAQAPVGRLRSYGAKTALPCGTNDRVEAMHNDKIQQNEAHGVLQIVPIQPDTLEFEFVLKLWRRNSQTLGNLPRGGFEDQARIQQLLGLFSDGSFAGYLLYRVSRTGIPRATIVHLCLRREIRGQGLAKYFVEDLKNRCGSLAGIGLHCRDDFDASRLWRSIGFVPRSEKPGRNQKGLPLTYWWFDNNLPGLFDYVSPKSVRVKAVLDSNILYDFADRTRNGSEISVPLLAGWISEIAELALSDELHEEIKRGNDSAQREKNRNWAMKFSRVISDQTLFKAAFQQLRSEVLQANDENTISDAKHLAHAIAGGYRYFLTRDRGLTDISHKTSDAFDLQILNPTDFILKLDVIEREESYRPYKFEGTGLTTRPTSEQDLGSLFDVFANKNQGEAKNRFQKKLFPLLSKPQQIKSLMYQTHGKPPVVLLVYEESKSRLVVQEIRSSKNRMAGTVLRYALTRLVLKAAESPNLALVTVMTDEWNETQELVDALEDCQFVRTQQGIWIKSVQRFVGSLDAMKILFAKLAESEQDLSTAISNTVSIAAQSWQSGDPDGRLLAERLLWPSKIVDDSATTFVVSIKPDWAQELFDEHRAAELLFGVNDRLLLNWENVYYRSRRNSSGLSKAGDRILWYVSTGTVKVQAIIACSIVEEVLIDSVDTLLQRFKNLGVYRRKDLEEIVHGETSEKLMAIRFSRTELLKRPISFAEFQTLLMRLEGRKSQLQSPTRIGAATFEHIYKVGFNMVEA